MAWLSLDRVAAIDRQIEELYAKIGMQERYPEVSLVEIVRKSGLEVYLRDFGGHAGNDVMGAIDFKGEGSTPVIYINKYNHPNNQKFTLAHELGHYVLNHRDQDMQFRKTSLPIFTLKTLKFVNRSWKLTILLELC